MVATDNSTLFKKGQSGNPAGRPKGSKNRIIYDIAEILQRKKCNPFEILSDIAMGTVEGYPKLVGIQARREAASDLCQYLLPKLKSVEITSDEFVEGFQMVFNVNKEKVADAVDNVQRNEDSKPVSS